MVPLGPFPSCFSAHISRRDTSILSHLHVTSSSGDCSSAIFVMPVGPPSLKPWLGIWTGWCSAAVFLSELHSVVEVLLTDTTVALLAVGGE